MPKKYWLDSTNNDVTCDGGIDPRDMDPVLDTGSASTVTFSTPFNIMADRGEFAIDVSGDNPLAGSRTYEVSVEVAANIGTGNAQFKLRAIDHTGCATDAESAAMTFTGTGTKTFTTTLDFQSTSDSLWLVVQLQFTGGGGGSKDITIRTNDVGSFVRAPWGQRTMVIS